MREVKFSRTEIFTDDPENPISPDKLFGNNFHIRTDDRNWSWSYLRKTFRDLSLEDLYDRYVLRLQNAYFLVYLIIQIFFSLFYIGVILIVNRGTLDKAVPETIGGLIVACVSISLFFLTCNESVFREKPRTQLIASATIILVHSFTDLGLSIYFYTEFDHARTSLVFSTLIAIYFFLPLPRLRQSIIFGVGVSLSHLLVSGIFLYTKTDNRVQRIIADLIYYSCGNAVGIFSKLMSEVTIRRAFLDRRGFINSTIKKNYEKDQEEQLLLSILPKHISIKVKNELLLALKQIEMFKERRSRSHSFFSHHHTHRNSDQSNTSTIGVIQRKPFSDLFVEKHENVTILFSDIVNFTPLTVKLKAVDLVATLNELFGRFDKAAKAHDCLRIKLLGDAYMAVSGLPHPTEDHGKNCVSLGFDMIEIIKDLRISDLRMRIGIHSGDVLSGLLGLYKWQFDIWSADVLIANCLEKTGEPGMIHISKQTRDILGGEYTYIPNYGKLKDKFLFDNNIETFLIKPIHPEDPDPVTPEPLEELPLTKEGFLARNGEVMLMHSQSMIDTVSINFGETSASQVDLLEVPQRPKRNKSIIRNAANAMIRKKSLTGRTDGDVKGEYLRNFQIMRRRVNEQMEKAIDDMPLHIHSQWCPGASEGNDSHNHNGKSVTPVLMTFHPISTELIYQKQPDPLFKFYVGISLIILLCIAGIQALIMPSHKTLWIAFSLGVTLILIIIPFVWVSYLWIQIKDPHMELEKIPKPENKLLLFFYKVSNIVSNSCLLRILIFLVVSTVVCTTSIIDVVECNTWIHPPTGGSTETELIPECESPWYFTYSCTLSILAIYAFFRLHFLLKGFIAICALTAYTLIIFDYRKVVFERDIGGSPAIPPFYSHLIYIFRIAALLHIMDRQMEYINRLDFIWKRKLNEEHKEASITHAINTILIHNILPMKIAKIYMDPNRVGGEGHSRNYKNVSVMFASIPNFMDSYTTDFANQGIKWLQLLNEIIVEFDQVLFDFVDVEKIKVIGSTYMAACGLEVQDSARLSTTSTSENSLLRNWRDSSVAANSTVNLMKRRKTLHTLVRFAASMMQRLEIVNKNAFQEFELRTGISCGAVVAGVIGATHPTYDIWSDAVNCASRYETHGEFGKIQVPEECAKLLMLEGVICERRGPIKIKGKPKPIVTYFVSLNDKLQVQYLKRDSFTSITF